MKFFSLIALGLVLAFASSSQGRHVADTYGVKADGKWGVVKESLEDGPFGQNGGGTPWSDGGFIHLYGRITAVEFGISTYVRSIRTRYGFDGFFGLFFI